jgi:hypothetical protein
MKLFSLVCLQKLVPKWTKVPKAQDTADKFPMRLELSRLEQIMLLLKISSRFIQLEMHLLTTIITIWGEQVVIQAGASQLLKGKNLSLAILKRI